MFCRPRRQMNGLVHFHADGLANFYPRFLFWEKSIRCLCNHQGSVSPTLTHCPLTLKLQPQLPHRDVALD